MGNAEAMVTARMGVGKKEEGNRVLASLGTNASKAVNQLYDYVIERGALRCSGGREAAAQSGRG